MLFTGRILNAFAAFAIAALALLASSSPAGAVVGGQSVPLAEDGAYPWTVALVNRADGIDKDPAATGGQFCGGTLIARRIVLTAAHCIVDWRDGTRVSSAEDLYVLAGQTSLRAAGEPDSTEVERRYRPGYRLYVQQISLHPDADVGDFRYDVALLTLTQPIPAALEPAIVAPVAASGDTETDVVPDQLRTASTTPEAWGPGTPAYVFGWGNMSTSGFAYPDVLQYAGGREDHMVRLSDAVCGRAWGELFSASDMLCVGQPDPDGPPPADSCGGDSGGPLLKRAAAPEEPYLDPAAHAQQIADAIRSGEPELLAQWRQQADAALRADEEASLRADEERIRQWTVDAWRAEEDADVRADEDLMARLLGETDEQTTLGELITREVDERLQDPDREALWATPIAAFIDREVAAEVERLMGLPPATEALDAAVEAQLTAEAQQRAQTEAAGQDARQQAAERGRGEQWRLLGVVSWGPEPCGQVDEPGVYARVGAPAIRTYVTDATPAPMPRLRSAGSIPLVGGAYDLGAAISCEPGGWVDATRFSYRIWEEQGTDDLYGSGDRLLASAPSYTVTLGDMRRHAARSSVRVACEVTARGEGGYAMQSTSAHLPVVVAPPQIGGNAGGGGGTPAAPSGGPAVDRQKPVVAKRGAICGKSRCTISVVAADRGAPSSGIKAVSGKLTIKRKSTCVIKSGKRKGKRRPCTKTITRSVKLKQSKGLWKATVKGLRKTDRTTLRVTARDGSGNAGVLRITLKVQQKKQPARR